MVVRWEGVPSLCEVAVKVRHPDCAIKILIKDYLAPKFQGGSVMITGNVIVFTEDDVEEDITLVLPDGQKIILQYRASINPKMPTIDVCMDNHVCLVNWRDDEMTPAIPDQHKPNVVDNVKHFMITFRHPEDA